jgi:exodeoxyribonuclease-3
MAKNIKIISWNVNGIRAMVKKGFYEIFNDLGADIFCIQETKADDQVLGEIAGPLKGYQYLSNSADKKGYSGTVVFTKLRPLNHFMDIGKKEHDLEGRVISLEYETFYLVNAYVPNAGQDLKRLDYRKVWDEELLTFLKGLDGKKPLVFAGDLNVAHEPIDLARPDANYNKTAGYTQMEINGFKNFLKAGLVDTYRYFNKDRIQYTFWNQRFNARANNVGWRIDYFLVSERILNKVKESFILDEIMGSDHCPVGIELEP